MIEINNHWKFRDSETESWLEAKVPGCVHTDLIRNKVIEDPFYRLNEHKVQWVDKKDWIYETTFEILPELLDKDRVVLEFEGLDTHAEVSLNGRKILEANNMFREWTVDVKARLKAGPNTLRIYFHSPIKTGIEKYDNYPHRVETSFVDLAEIGQVPEGKQVSPHLRKAPYHFGWDWGPRLVTSGIWKPITLRTWDQARLSDLQIVQEELDPQKARLTACFEIEAEEPISCELQINVNNEIIKTVPAKIQSGTGVYKVDFIIRDPQLWWTNGLGKATLYHIEGILHTETEQLRIDHQIGLRTLELIREKDSEGTSFYFKLNGHPVFMKGANYIPADVFLDRVDRDKYEKIIETARLSNFNMLRIWGGGIYEKDIFYDLCDQNGILVWQDFMFACNMYPGHTEFFDSVRLEARDNIRRLRNHPSLAIWCGNNEILSAWHIWGWKDSIKKENPAGAKAQWKAYRDLFLDLLPEVVSANDPGRFYWASSPQSGDKLPEDLKNGDCHYWGVWWGKEPFENYHTYLARFMSEYGFQSFPELRTVKTYATEEDFDIYSEVMKSHQRSTIGNETIETYMLRDYREPKDFESYLYMSHVLQAEGVKKAMEGHRIAMPYTMGSLYWQINDCWPVASWSSTDYHVNWKALQYYSKKAFDQILVAPRLEEDLLKVHVVSDFLEPLFAMLSIKIMDFSGESLWSVERQIEIGANASQSHFEAPVVDILEGLNSKEVVLEARIKSGTETLARNHFYFSPIKYMELPEPSIKISSGKSEGGFRLELETDFLAKHLYLRMDEEGFFTDNYFDLLPGETKIVFLHTKSSGDPLEMIRIRTLRDTYK
jgi:beta-mannosidase